MPASDPKDRLKRLKSRVRVLVADDELLEACDLLISSLHTESTPYTRTIGFRRRVVQLAEEVDDGIISKSDANLERNKVGRSILELVKSISEADLAAPNNDDGGASDTTAKKDRLPLHEYHSYTCNRIDQQDRFQAYHRKVKNQPQFYYLYGLKKQAHEGMVNRLAFYLEGNSFTVWDGKIPMTREVPHGILPIPRSKTLENYKTNMLRSLISYLGLDPDNFEPLEQQTLQDIWKKSPVVSKLSAKAKDKICIAFTISHRQWDKKMIPDAVEWFIHDFCLKDLSDEAPMFIFFFSVKYPDRVSDQIRMEINEVIQEVEQTIEERKRNLVKLPELEMVCIDDIEEWFEQYSKIEPRDYKREELMQKYFGEQEEYYMEYVQDKLLEIIQLYNDGQLNR